VIVGDLNGQISILNSSSLSLIRTFQAHSSRIIRIKQSPFLDDTSLKKYVATCSSDSTVKVWDSASSSNWPLIQTYSQHSSQQIFGLEWLDADTLASSGLNDRTIKIWSVSTGQTKRTLSTGIGYVYSLKLLSNKVHLCVGGGGAPFDLQIYNINDGSLVSSLQGHTSWVYDLVQLSSDLLASASQDKTVRIWNLTTNSSKFTLQGHTNWVNSLRLISAQVVASASQDATIRLWNVTSGLEMRSLTGHTGAIYWSLDMMTSGGQAAAAVVVVSGAGDQSIRVWNWTSGECLRTSAQPNSNIRSLAVIYGANEQIIQTTTTKTSKELLSLSTFDFCFFLNLSS
jgi:WD40 repeat protein